MVQYQVFNLSQGRVMTFVMLKQTANPKSLNEIVIRFSPGELVESHSCRRITKAWQLKQQRTLPN